MRNTHEPESQHDLSEALEAEEIGEVHVANTDSTGKVLNTHVSESLR
jgi:hypothetical protein